MAQDLNTQSVPPVLRAVARAAKETPWLKQVLPDAKKGQALSEDLSHMVSDLRRGSALIPSDKIATVCAKFKAQGRCGERVYWYYKDCARFAKREGFDVRDHAGYSGVLVPRTSIDKRHIYDIEDLVVIHDTYPTEKCPPDVQWLALIRLMVCPDVVEIFSK